MNRKRIESVNFGVLSPEEIEKYAVIEVTKAETYENGVQVEEGLFDTRMGVIEEGLRCGTCMQKSMECPGHFGYIRLAKPVYNVLFMETIKGIMSVICNKCSKLLVDKSKLKLGNISSKHRLRLIKKHLGAKKLVCEHCKAIQPKYEIDSGSNRLMYKYENEENREKLLAEYTLNVLKRLADSDIEYLGFSPKYSRPEWFIFVNLPVPPPAIRPSVRRLDNSKQEDDLVAAFMNIINKNNTLKKKLETKTKSIEEFIHLLFMGIALMIDNSVKVANLKMIYQGGKPIKSLKERLSSKGGRLRQNLMGKRVDFSGRTVISADPNISLEEVGTPYEIAMNLTFPERVTLANIDEMYRLIQNGPTKYPGANVLIQNGISRQIEFIKEEIILEPGDIVERHLMNGDVVLFNRQPSLHRMSMQGHKVRVMPFKTFRMNLSACTP
jgi:DNA-directed RNA polymerase subunit A'